MCRGMPELCWPPLLIIILLVRAVITRGFVGAAVPKEECKHPRSSSKNLQLWTSLECLSLLECVYSFRPIATLQSELPAYHYLALSGDTEGQLEEISAPWPDVCMISRLITQPEQTIRRGLLHYIRRCLKYTGHTFCSWQQNVFFLLI